MHLGLFWISSVLSTHVTVKSWADFSCHYHCPSACVKPVLSSYQIDHMSTEKKIVNNLSSHRKVFSFFSSFIAGMVAFYLDERGVLALVIHRSFPPTTSILDSYRASIFKHLWVIWKSQTNGYINNFLTLITLQDYAHARDKNNMIKQNWLSMYCILCSKHLFKNSMRRALSYPCFIGSETEAPRGKIHCPKSLSP